MVSNYIKFSHLFCSIEHYQLENQEKLHVLLLRKKKGEFLKQDSFSVDTLGDLHTKLPKNQHVFLIVNNNYVLSKATDNYIMPEKAIMSWFPNLVIDDFYYEFHSHEQSSFISICRKDYVLKLLESYKDLNINIIGFSLGNLCASQLAIYNKNSLSTTNSILEFREHKLSNIIDLKYRSLETFEINGLNVTSSEVLPLSGILQYYSGHQLTFSNFNKVMEELKKNFILKGAFDKGLKIGLIIIFILLLISFLFLSHYNSKINELNQDLVKNKTQKAEYLSLHKEVEKKRILIQEFSLASSKSSWYIDQIGQTIPLSISLNALEWQPLIKSIKTEQAIENDPGVIIVKGTSYNANEYSEWISTLEQLIWIEKVIITHYGLDRIANASFEIKILFNS